MADTIIEATITIYEAAEYEGATVLPTHHDTEDAALEAIPHALRSLP